ncbi:uncharacterized protein Bfra_009742 [Botrytis fragariae]|uniref:Uncharacterized protein n=1 Tax=Botrytis fragariae TaxID=1964551 RepID=A0A8H6AN35_9HELO|nr:uncharacterized protein Bfra_009742 [Botrytis fragariae]KAF5870358.1 hypothetical protein Bfra_009742 [Botrytis fragariae]
MSDHGSHYSSDGNPFSHPGYGATVISAGVGMGMLRSGIPAGNEPVPRVPRSLYDKKHCGACDASTERSDGHWKEEHIHDNIECRRAYLDGTCEYERYAFAVMPDRIYAPEGYVPPTQTPQLQYSNPQFQIQETQAYSSEPPGTQSETQSTQAYFIPHSPQYLQEQQHSDQALSPNAYQTNHPSAWLHSRTNPSQPDQGYTQHPTEMQDDSYTGDESHNSSPAHGSGAQRAPVATVGASQGRGYTNATLNSGSSHRGSRRAGSSRRS